jgi:hypothetical protein
LQLRADPAEIAVVEIDKDGGVHIPGNAGVAYGQWEGTLRQVRSLFSHPYSYPLLRHFIYNFHRFIIPSLS